MQVLIDHVVSLGGYVHPGLDLASPRAEGGRGVVATARVAVGEQLLLVPMAACIRGPTDEEWARHQAGEDAGVSPAAAHLRQAGLAPFPTAVARLMAEAAAGPASPYAAYLAVLPPDHDCLLAWDPDQLNWLSGTSLEGADDPAAARRLYDDVVEPAIRRAPTLWPPEACGYDRFVWAAGMVLSRAFHLRNDCVVAGGAAEGDAQLYMVPLADMVNHSPREEDWGTTLARSPEALAVAPGALFTVGGFFTMKADRALEVGKELMHCYGELSSAALVRTYGFVDEGDNPAEATVLRVQELEIGGVEARVPALDRRLADLRECRRLGDGFVVNIEDPMSDELLSVAIMASMDDACWAGVAPLVRADPGLVLPEGYLETPAGGLGATVMLKAAEAALERNADMDAGEDAEEAVAAGGAAGRRGTAALNMRLGEKNTLQEFRREAVRVLLRAVQRDATPDNDGAVGPTSTATSSDDDASNASDASISPSPSPAPSPPQEAGTPSGSPRHAPARADGDDSEETLDVDSDDGEWRPGRGRRREGGGGAGAGGGGGSGVRPRRSVRRRVGGGEGVEGGAGGGGA